MSAVRRTIVRLLSQHVESHIDAAHLSYEPVAGEYRVTYRVPAQTTAGHHEGMHRDDLDNRERLYHYRVNTVEGYVVPSDPNPPVEDMGAYLDSGQAIAAENEAIPDLTASENWTDPEAVLALCMSVPPNHWVGPEKYQPQNVENAHIGNSLRVERTPMFYRVYEVGVSRRWYEGAKLLATVTRPRLVDPKQADAVDPDANLQGHMDAVEQRLAAGTELPLVHLDRQSLPR
jgi:hypothetical protein